MSTARMKKQRIGFIFLLFFFVGIVYNGISFKKTDMEMF